MLSIDRDVVELYFPVVLLDYREVDDWLDIVLLVILAKEDYTLLHWVFGEEEGEQVFLESLLFHHVVEEWLEIVSCHGWICQT